MKTISIIHLSDIHIVTDKTISTLEGKGKINSNLERHLGEQVSILDDLKNSIEKMCSDLKINNCTVLVTGDIAYSGQPDEYELAKNFFNSLKESGVYDNIIICPGNHDVNREMYTHTEIMKGLLLGTASDIKDVNKSLEHRNGVKQCKENTENFYKFLDELESKNKIKEITNSLCIYRIYKQEIENVHVYYISLNSSFLYAPEYAFYGYLSKYQIDSALRDVRKWSERGSKTINIGLFHHPFEAQVPIDLQNIQHTISSEMQLVFTGHTHSPRLLSDYSGAQELYNNNDTTKALGLPIYSGARCVFDEEGDNQIVQGYSIIQIDIDDEGILEIRLFPVRFIRDLKKWEMVRDSPVNINVRQIKETTSLRYDSKIDNLKAKKFYDLGNKAFESGDFPSAIVLFEEALEYNKDFSDAYFNKALTEFMYSKHQTDISKEKILEDINKADELKPNLPDISFLKARVYEAYNELDKAFESYEEAIDRIIDAELRSWPILEVVDLKYLIKEYYNDVQKYNKWKVVAEKLSELYSAYKILHKEEWFIEILARANLKAENYEVSRLYYANLVDKDRNSPEYHNNFADVLARTQEFDKALEEINKAIEIEKKELIYYITRLEIYILKGNSDQEIDEAFKDIGIEFPNAQICELLKEELEQNITDIEKKQINRLISDNCNNKKNIVKS